MIEVDIIGIVVFFVVGFIILIVFDQVKRFFMKLIYGKEYVEKKDLYYLVEIYSQKEVTLDPALRVIDKILQLKSSSKEEKIKLLKRKIEIFSFFLERCDTTKGKNLRIDQIDKCHKEISKLIHSDRKNKN